MTASRTLIALVTFSTTLFINAAQTAYGQDRPLLELPDGEYRYLGEASSEFWDQPYVLLQKWGRIVIGVDADLPSEVACFKGFIEGNSIIDATRVLPPYTPDAEWEYQSGEMLNLDQYDRVTEPVAMTDGDTSNLEICLEVFAR